MLMENIRTYELEDREFFLLRDIVYKETGISLTDRKKALLRSRLTKRLRKLDLESFTHYYNYLLERYEEEKVFLINAITTNKTEFFRENKHFEYLKNIFLPACDKANRNVVKIWSSACSTGEEAYSIAITLLEYYENKLKVPEIKILATDIDTQVLDTAIEGIYSFDQVETIDMPLLKKYFLKGVGENEGMFKVKQNLRDLVTFAHLNLQSESYPMKGSFEAIFCRNVIIYFDKETQKKIFKKFSCHLHDHGILFLGHSENLLNLSTDFRLIGNTMYEKIIPIE